MDFVEAMRLIKQGEKVTRTAWNNRQNFVCLQGGMLMIYTDDCLYHTWMISEVDVYARDWTTVADA
jgi:hypothetical protein